MRLFLGFVIVLFIGCGARPDLTFSQDQIENLIAPYLSEKVSNSYIISFTLPNKIDKNTVENSSFYTLTQTSYLGVLNELKSQTGVKEIEFISVSDLSPHLSNSVKPSPLLISPLGSQQKNFNQTEANYAVVAQVNFDNESYAKAKISEWQKQGKVLISEPNWINKNQSTQFSRLTAGYRENKWFWIDSMRVIKSFQYIDEQIALGKINENEMFENPPVVAVLDSGIDYDHPAFRGRLWENERTGQSDCPDDIHGCDVTYKQKGVLGRGDTIYPFGVRSPGVECPNSDLDAEGDIASNCLHGTHVSGIIAGRVEEDVPGVCPLCKIMMIKVVGDEFQNAGSVSDASLLRGMTYLSRFTKKSQNAIRVVNASISKFHRSRHVALIVNQIKNYSKGALLVGAAGNEDTSFRSYPAALNDALAVTSVRRDGIKASYANFGQWVDVSAPGGDSEAGGIYSASPGSNEPAESQGTSMAAPMVSGLAGMLLAANPSMTAEELKSRIVKTADPFIYNSDVTFGQNDSYFKYIERDKIYLPLLGSGRADFFSAFTNEEQGINTKEQLQPRVTPGCAVLLAGGENNKSHIFYSILFIIFVPFTFLVRRIL